MKSKLALILLGLMFGIAVQEVQAEDRFDGVRKHSKELFNELDNLNYHSGQGTGVFRNADIAHESIKDFEALEYLHKKAKSEPEKERIRQRMAKTVLLTDKETRPWGKISIREGNWAIFAESDGMTILGSIISPDGEKSTFNFAIQ